MVVVVDSTFRFPRSTGLIVENPSNDDIFVEEVIIYYFTTLPQCFRSEGTYLASNTILGDMIPTPPLPHRIATS